MNRLVGIIGMDREIDSPLGISSHVICRRQIVDLLIESGVLPVVIPPHTGEPQEIISRIDGLVIPGGGDIHPRYYGDTVSHPSLSWLDPQRDLSELDLVRSALERDIPIFGICRGLQLLNVALGGTLIQHLPDIPSVSCNHSTYDAFHRPVHQVTINENTLLSRCFPGSPILSVNSIHHQAIKSLGDGLTVTAVSEDGVIEGIESMKHTFVLGVQWHPELMEDRNQRALFQMFANAVKKG